MKVRLLAALEESESYPDKLIVALVSKTVQKQSNEVKLWCVRGGVIFALRIDNATVTDNGSFVEFIARCANRQHDCRFAAKLRFTKPDLQLGLTFF